MRVAIPHNLDPDEVRARLRQRSHEIADHIPGGMARVDTEWMGEDRMKLTVNAMGQALEGQVDIEPAQLVVDITLPPALGFVEPMISSCCEVRSRTLPQWEHATDFAPRSGWISTCPPQLGHWR